MTEYSLATYVLQERHMPVLRDWLAFLHHPPRELAVHIADDPAIAAALEVLCAEFGITLKIIRAVTVNDVARGEAGLMAEQFAAASSEFMVVMRLDTFVFREGDPDWLHAVFAALAEDNYVFFTAAQNRFRGDRPVAGTPFLTTRHVSNNLAIYRREKWLSMQAHATEHRLFDPARKLFAERSVIMFCFDQQVHGIRRLSGRNWRALHTNAWDERMFSVRRDAMAGVGLDAYLAPFEEDKWHPWERYYGHPRPSLAALPRFWLDEVRGYLRRRGPRKFPMPLE